MFGGPVVDSLAPHEGTKGTVEDGTRVLIDRVEVDNSLWGYMAVEYKGDKAFVKEESVSFLVVLD